MPKPMTHDELQAHLWRAYKAGLDSVSKLHDTLPRGSASRARVRRWLRAQEHYDTLGASAKLEQEAYEADWPA